LWPGKIGNTACSEAHLLGHRACGNCWQFLLFARAAESDARGEAFHLSTLLINSPAANQEANWNEATLLDGIKRGAHCSPLDQHFR